MSDIFLISFLSESKIFRGLSEKDLQTVSTYGSVKQYEKNHLLINEGEVNTELYVLLKGQVEVFLPKKSDHTNKTRATKINLGRLMPGDCLGEYSVVDNDPASASVVTLETCDLFRIPKTNFETIVNSYDHLAKMIYKNMLHVLIKRARDFDRELDLCYIL